MRPAQRLKVFLSQAAAAGYFAVKKGTQTQADLDTKNRTLPKIFRPQSLSIL